MADNSSTIAIKFSNATVSFGSRIALEDVTFSLPEGEFLGVIGPNGAGKSVMLRTILGLFKPVSGAVEVFGELPEVARKYVGYVPQFAKFESQFPITVREVVLMGRLGTNFKINFSRDDSRAVEMALEQVALGDLADAQVGNLSGGQIQRVLIARALVGQPRLLLLDEPTASLDSKVGKSLFDLLAELSKQMTIVLVSHDIGVVAEHVQSIACVNRCVHYHPSGQITADMLHETYGCPVELLGHGHAHRVLPEHHCDHDHSKETK